MPFPLAHPAAVLPLRRWCPKILHFPSLVIGSITPDLATSIDDWEYFSHTIPGTFLFCLPVGILTLWIFYQLRIPLVSTFPNRHRDALLPLCNGIPNPFGSMVASLLIGSWLHVVWDLFTHEHSWLVQHFAFFSWRIATLPLNAVLWLLSSFGGIWVLLKAYGSVLKRTKPAVQTFWQRDRHAYAFWSLILIIPLAGAVPWALQGFTPGDSPITVVRALFMYYLGCAYIILTLVGLALRHRIRRIKESG